MAKELNIFIIVVKSNMKGNSLEAKKTVKEKNIMN